MQHLYPPCLQQKHWKIEFTTIIYPIKEHDNFDTKSENITLLQTIDPAQLILTNRLIKNIILLTLPNGHFWSQLVIYKRDRFDHWRCLTCYKPMGKKNRHRNSVLYPEFFTTLTDGNYTNASGDDVHHGHSAHLYAETYLQQKREAKRAIK